MQCVFGGTWLHLVLPTTTEKSWGKQQSVVLLLRFHTFTIYLIARPAQAAVGIWTRRLRWFWATPPGDIPPCPPAWEDVPFPSSSAPTR